MLSALFNRKKLLLSNRNQYCRDNQLEDDDLVEETFEDEPDVGNVTRYLNFYKESIQPLALQGVKRRENVSKLNLLFETENTS